MEPIRVLLVEDHTLVRDGIRSLLQNSQGITLVGETGKGVEVVPLIKEHHPDVVLMDIALPDSNGLEITRQLTKDFPQVRVIIVSMNKTEEYVLQAMRSGAAGYLLKDNSFAELDQAIRLVAQGQTYLSPEVSKHVIAGYVQSVGEEHSSLSRLTPRQRQVLQLIAERHSTKEIARKLNLSVKTVEMHRTQLMDALDIHDIAGLVYYALRTKLVNLQP